jgi:hypothetical protein
MKIKPKVIVPTLIVLGCFIAGLYIQGHRITPKISEEITKIDNCSPTLKACGAGCIPQNAKCCDEAYGNSYCLGPGTNCETNTKYGLDLTEKRFLCSDDGKDQSHDCAVGQIACGMFCIKAGEKCCSLGICQEEKKTVPDEKNTVFDLNGLWKAVNGKVYKIVQTGDSLVFTTYRLPDNWAWQGKVGDVSVEGTLAGNKFTGTVYIVPEREYCQGYKWPHKYSATVSKDGKTINATYTANMYWRETCQETGEYPQKSETLTILIPDLSSARNMP